MTIKYQLQKNKYIKMNRIKKFEEFNTSLWASTEEELTNYFKCSDCGSLYYEFNQIDNSCKYCNSKNLKQISSAKYFFDIKKRLDDDEFNIELDKKRERENKLVDLISTGINKEIKTIKRNIN